MRRHYNPVIRYHLRTPAGPDGQLFPIWYFIVCATSDKVSFVQFPDCFQNCLSWKATHDMSSFVKQLMLYHSSQQVMSHHLYNKWYTIICQRKTNQVMQHHLLYQWCDISCFYQRYFVIGSANDTASHCFYQRYFIICSANDTVSLVNCVVLKGNATDAVLFALQMMQCLSLVQAIKHHLHYQW